MIDLSKFEGHTPGPWTLRIFPGHSTDQIFAGETMVLEVDMIDQDKFGIVVVSGEADGIDPKQFRPNALLCAAAPSLLSQVSVLTEALEKIVAFKNSYDNPNLARAQDIARTALSAQAGSIEKDGTK